MTNNEPTNSELKAALRLCYNLLYLILMTEDVSSKFYEAKRKLEIKYPFIKDKD